MIVTTPLRWYGGKGRLAKQLVSRFPRHSHYVEPFFGGGSVLLNRDPSDESLWLAPHRGVSEIANDVYGHLINFWRVLQSEEMFPLFARAANVAPFSRDSWEASRDLLQSGRAGPVDRALAFFVYCRQSYSGNMTAFSPPRRDSLRCGMQGVVSDWLSAVERLPEVHARLRSVFIENLPAIQLIEREDAPHTFFYLDPPYIQSTRRSSNGYAEDMSLDHHMDLLDCLRGVRGRVMLSGYAHSLYDEVLWNWRREVLDVPNFARGAVVKRLEEVIWMNY